MNFREQLISAVEKEPALYDKTIRDYKCLEKKERAWQRVSMKIGIDDKKCQKLWKSLRDCFVRERNRRKSMKRISGKLPKRWKFYNRMQFLDNHVVKKTKSSKLSTYTEIQPSSDNASTPNCKWLNSFLSAVGESPTTTCENPTSSCQQQANKCDISSSSDQESDRNKDFRPSQRRKGRLRAAPRDSDDVTSLKQVYQELIDIVKMDERTEVDLLFEQMAKIVKKEDLSNLQFLELQCSLTRHLKEQLEKIRYNFS